MSIHNIHITAPDASKAYFDTARPDFPIPTLAFRWNVYEGDIRVKVVCNKQIRLRPTSGRDDIDYFVLGSVRYMPREAIIKHNFKDEAELRRHMSIQAEHVLQLTCKLRPLEREVFVEGYLYLSGVGIVSQYPTNDAAGDHRPRLRCTTCNQATRKLRFCLTKSSHSTCEFYI